MIGQGNKIPWYLPEDFRWFKEMTMGHVIVMGRKTFESLGKPLPNRKNLVLTRHLEQLNKNHPKFCFREWRGESGQMPPYQFNFSKFNENEKTEILVATSLAKLDPMDFPSKVIICGGAQIYEQALFRCSDLYLTIVKRIVGGDAFFPAFEDRFQAVEEMRDCAEFKIIHFRNRSLFPATQSRNMTVGQELLSGDNPPDSE